MRQLQRAGYSVTSVPRMAGVRLCGRLDRMTRVFCWQRKHFAAFAALQHFGSYRTNNEHHGTLVRRGSVAIVESPGGISPPGAPKTVREPLDSHGSRCSTVGTRATGFTSSTGSSCCQMASVGPWPRLNNAAPSVQPHYKAFIPTTGHSAPVLRIGTLVLAVVAA